ncbi:MAG: cytochrome C oxidase subunit IV family protein [Actinobacteria bacterium]|nr:cytochrome C oxidase subunit IV family protein [Actinomycetota bacterium]
MATDTTAKTDAQHAGVHETDVHHPEARDYVKIAVVLAILTGLEIAASYIEVGGLFLPLLLGLMAIKFFLVAAFFMHLRYDTRLYTRFMVTGLVLAGALYTVVLVINSSQPGSS